MSDMSDNVKVESIKLAINGITIELPIADARKLQEALDGALGPRAPVITVYPYMVPYFPPGVYPTVVDDKITITYTGNTASTNIS